MASHSGILAQRIPWPEDPAGLLSRRVTQSQTQLKRLSMHACIGEGNGSPFLYSCPEYPRDTGAWWAAVYGVAQSRVQLKRLSSSSSTIKLLLFQHPLMELLKLSPKLLYCFTFLPEMFESSGRFLSSFPIWHLFQESMEYISKFVLQDILICPHYLLIYLYSSVTLIK